MKTRLSLVTTLLLLLAACSPGGAPRLIGAQPRSGVPVPANAHVVYTAYLTLEVADVDAAADRAVGYAGDYGGYLVESRAWTSEGRRYETLTLAVPVPNFDGLRAALLGLGTLVSETVSSEPKPIGRDDWNTFTHIVVELQPARSVIALPAPPRLWGWDPGRTFSQAFGVTFGIFAFLADVLIWVVVVIGPFALAGWLVWRLVRRRASPK